MLGDSFTQSEKALGAEVYKILRRSERLYDRYDKIVGEIHQVIIEFGNAGKARGQPFCRTLTPRDLVPSMRWQADRKLLRRNRPVLAITPQQLWRSPVPRPLLRRPRPSSRRHTDVCGWMPAT